MRNSCAYYNLILKLIKLIVVEFLNQNLGFCVHISKFLIEKNKILLTTT